MGAKRKFGQVFLYIQNQIWYHTIIALLAFGSAGMLIYEFYFGGNKTLIESFKNIDLIIAYIFLVDFIIGVYLAPKKLFHIRHNFLDLLGSIPISDGLFRAMRILRFARLVRLLRAANAGLNIQSSVKNLGNTMDQGKNPKRRREVKRG